MYNNINLHMKASSSPKDVRILVPSSSSTEEDDHDDSEDVKGHERLPEVSYCVEEPRHLRLELALVCSRLVDHVEVVHAEEAVLGRMATPLAASKPALKRLQSMFPCL